MRVLAKIAVGSLALLLCLAVIATGYRVWKQIEIKRSTAITSSDGIESLERVKLNGAMQWIYIRGQSIDNPILLNLHGGPGVTEMWAARSIGLDLEDHFTVVHWDQRGAGKSAREDYDLATLSVDTYVQDTLALVHYLRQRFEQDKIVLVGHSWGTVPGVMVVRDHPELFHAYIGASQIVDLDEMEQIGLQYVRQRAEEEQNANAIEQLKDIAPPYLEDNIDDLGVQRRWLAHYGGAMRNISVVDGAHTLFTSPEYTLGDIAGLFQMGTTAKHIWPQLKDIDFVTQAPSLEVPVFLLVGRYDYQTPFELTQRYYDVLDAPHKELIWFEESAHLMKFSAPERYQEVLIERVLPKVN